MAIPAATLSPAPVYATVRCETLSKDAKRRTFWAKTNGWSSYSVAVSQDSEPSRGFFVEAQEMLGGANSSLRIRPWKARGSFLGSMGGVLPSLLMKAARFSSAAWRSSGLRGAKLHTSDGGVLGGLAATAAPVWAKELLAARCTGVEAARRWAAARAAFKGLACPGGCCPSEGRPGRLEAVAAMAAATASAAMSRTIAGEQRCGRGARLNGAEAWRLGP
mmetsp:Transcript_37561/g.79827  ORF Transcript_37561/g.79827 Transcript_37561/m.79827 type:complete len:219 (-) Transcript_37561:9-665(-)